MRRFLRPCFDTLALAALCAALSVSAVSAQSAQPAPASSAPAPGLDAIVAKNIQAKGGEAKLKAIQSMKMSGRVTIQGMDLSMLITTKRPNMMRQEMQFQDKKIVQGFDGTTAWMINPLMGSETAQEMTGPQADLAKDQADFDGPLLDWKGKGHTLEFVGTEDVGGAKAHKLKLTKKNGQVQYLYLDAESGIDLKTTVQVPQGASTMTVETEMSDYRPVEGIMMPHALKTSINGMPTGSIVVDKIELNTPIDEAQFKMPAAPKPAPKP
jgi:outer membrane lipoprotein-sorting protein